MDFTLIAVGPILGPGAHQRQASGRDIGLKAGRFARRVAPFGSGDGGHDAQAQYHKHADTNPGVWNTEQERAIDQAGQQDEKADDIEDES
jgi:hypothetical protein